MTKDEFKKIKGYGFDTYKSVNKVTTGIGVFEMELQMEGKEPINEQMLLLMKNLIEFGTSHIEAIHDLIQLSYQEACDKDSTWVEDMCNVPLNLSKHDIMKHVNNLSFIVSSDTDRQGGFDSFVHVIPDWDEEHSIYLRYTDEFFTRFDPMETE
ncbi:MAG: DUF6985 domain-containing protein [Bacteroidota bacterium]